MQQVMYSVDIDTTYTKFGWKETPDVFSEFGPAKVNVTFYLRRLKSPRLKRGWENGKDNYYCHI